MYFNKVILLGRLVKDPEIKFTPKGLAVSKFTLALSKKNKRDLILKTENYTSNSKLNDEVLYIDVNSFGERAEIISKFFKKGILVLIEGRLKLNRWTTVNGELRTNHSIILENFQFLPNKINNSKKLSDNTDEVTSDEPY
ncbi:single-stranded DNA-binding protein [Candidatus Pinguicoccus supinus]|uniref:Single-stranded DNA-binding protein n=1 Tax=Candidatus Pinguicoccus supinus TaxID=2529394 RepID=A0A7T0FXQ2_9BACT|nr:single-stranded DNA-binding protein [Candidatus Pinguicoccus supinus]